ncbi:MAG: site-specific integrase [Truepera sp.]|nr:site-specific integrase [Truepera sp.]
MADPLELAIASLQVSAALQVSAGDQVGRARFLASLSTADLRRLAVRAANERDFETLWQLTEAHLTLHGESGALVSVNTYKAYRRGVKDLLAAWQGENLLRPGRDAAAVWLRTMECRGRKPATVRVKIAAGKALYKALRWAGATEAEPFADAKAAKDKTAPWERQGAYSQLEVTRLLAVADPVTRALILLGAHAGLRISEMLALRWSEVDLVNRKLVVLHGKGDKKRTVNLSKTLSEALGQLVRPPHPACAPAVHSQGQDLGVGGPAHKLQDGWVLPFRSRLSARERLARTCRAAGVRFQGLHALRHAAGTLLQRQTGDITKVADHLGHATLDMARNYAKADDRALKAVVDEW